MAKKPEEWLEKASPPEKTKGSFKLFLGYAPGVGKTYTMLSEGIRRHSRGEDVVIGIVETHGRKGIVELAEQLETVPRRKIEYKGTVFEEMDVDAIIARHPQVVLVDELAHTNIPGSKHRKRYEDVQEILAAKIDVLSTLNIQHMESIAPTVHTITGHHRPRNRSRLGSADGQRNRDGGPDAGGSAEPPAPRRRLQPGKGGSGAQEFLSRRQSHRLARTGAAPGRRARGPQPGILHGGQGD